MGTTTTMEVLANRQQLKQPSQKPAAAQSGPRRTRQHKRRSQPVDPIELSRRLYVVFAQQQNAEALATADITSMDSLVDSRMIAKSAERASPAEMVQAEPSTRMRKPLSVPSQGPHTTSSQPSAHRRLREASSKLPVIIAASADPASAGHSQPYVPQRAAQQFVTTTTVSGTWRPASLQRQRTQAASHQDTEVASSVTIQAQDACSAEKEPQDRRSFAAQHAFKDSLVFPKGSDKGIRHNRKILEWASNTASVPVDVPKDDSRDQNQASLSPLERETSNKDKAEGDREPKKDWSIVKAPLDSQIVDEHRVDWTQRDEAVLQPPPEQQPEAKPMSVSVRQSKSLWSIRTRLEGSLRERHPVSPNRREGSKASTGASPALQSSSLLPPPSFMSSPRAKAAPKSLKSPKSAIFSLFKHSS